MNIVKSSNKISTLINLQKNTGVIARYGCNGNTHLHPVDPMYEKREEIWLSPMTKAPTPTEKSNKQRDNIINATKNFDYTTIADRLSAVSWSNSSHPTGVIKTGLWALNPPTHHKSGVINRTWHSINPVWNTNTFTKIDTCLKIIKNKMKHFNTIWPY